MKRRHISLKEKLAAVLYLSFSDSGHWTELAPLQERKATADEVLALFHWDHGIFHAHGGSDVWWNLTPMLVADHRDKTKKDLGIIAKGKRIQRKEARHKAALAMKGNHEPA